MEIKKIFSDVVNILPAVYSDTRGSFSEIYNKKSFALFDLNDNFIQDNLSISQYKNTIRGLHFQLNPLPQSKLIRVVRGSIFDVFIDLRKDSKDYNSFGSYFLNPENGWIYIPEGFAHGFCTLEDNTIVSYKVNNYYDQDLDSGIFWDDPFFKINWPLNGEKPILSNKDLALPMWNDIMSEVIF